MNLEVSEREFHTILAALRCYGIPRDQRLVQPLDLRQLNEPFASFLFSKGSLHDPPSAHPGGLG